MADEALHVKLSSKPKKTKGIRPPGAGKRGPIPGEGGRPKKQLSPEQLQQLEGLATIGATQGEMATFLGIDAETLAARAKDTISVAEALSRGESKFRIGIRRRQREVAFSSEDPGHTQMLIHMGKVYLGQNQTVHLKIDSPAAALEKLRALFPDLGDELAGLIGQP